MYLVADEEEGYDDLMWEAFVPRTLLSDGSSETPFRIRPIATVRREAKRMPGKRFLRQYVKKIEKLMQTSHRNRDD